MFVLLNEVYMHPVEQIWALFVREKDCPAGRHVTSRLLLTSTNSAEKKSTHFLGNRNSHFLLYRQILVLIHPIAILPLFTLFIYVFGLFTYLFIHIQGAIDNSDNGYFKKSIIFEQETGKGVELTVD